MGRIGVSVRDFRTPFTDMYRAVLQACKGITEVECVGRECLFPEGDECTVELVACKPRLYSETGQRREHTTTSVGGQSL